MRITFESMSELTAALKRAADAHHGYEFGHAPNADGSRWSDPNWPAWYARHMAFEQSPKEPARLDAEGQAIVAYRRAEQQGDVASFEKGYL